MARVLEQRELVGLVGDFLTGTDVKVGEAKLLGLFRGLWKENFVYRQELMRHGLEYELLRAEARARSLQMDQARQAWNEQATLGLSERDRPGGWWEGRLCDPPTAIRRAPTREDAEALIQAAGGRRWGIPITRAPRGLWNVERAGRAG